MGYPVSLYSLWLFLFDWDSLVIIWEMFHWKISLSLAILLLVVNFVSGFNLELMYVSLILSISSSLSHLHGFRLLVLLPKFIGITFFRLYQQNKSSEPRVKFRQASSCCKRVLEEAAKLPYANKTEESITSQKLGSKDFWWIANNVLNRGKSAIFPQFNGPEVLSSDKGKLFAKNLSKNSNLDDYGISLLFCSSKTNLKLHNISLTPRWLKVS